MSWIKKAAANNKIELLSQKYKLPIQQIQSISESCDPTLKKLYLDWILRCYKSGTIRLPEDASKTHEALQMFTKSKNRLPEDRRDVNKFKSPGDIKKLLDELGVTTSKREQTQINTTQGQRVVLVSPPYQVIEITTPEAAAKLCRNTEWCIKDPKYFVGEYNMGPTNPCYMITKNGRPHILWHQPTDQLKDTYDEDFSPVTSGSDDFDECQELFIKMGKAGIPQPAINLYTPDMGGDHIYIAVGIAEDYGLDWLFNVMQKYPNEDVAFQAANCAAWFCIQNNQRDPRFEPHISKDPHLSLDYAISCIRGPFPEAEPNILANKMPRDCFRYAVEARKSRWPEAEPLILNSSYGENYRRTFNMN